MKIDSLRLIAILAMVAAGVSYFARQPRAQEKRTTENHAPVTPTAEDLAAAPRIVKSDADWKTQLTPAQYAVVRGKGTERPGSSDLLREHRHGVFRCVACRSTLRQRREIRVGDRLAKFFPTIYRSEYRDVEGQLSPDGAGRSGLRALQWTPRSRFRRWPGADRFALLPERRGLEIRRASVMALLRGVVACQRSRLEFMCAGPNARRIATDN